MHMMSMMPMWIARASHASVAALRTGSPPNSVGRCSAAAFAASARAGCRFSTFAGQVRGETVTSAIHKAHPEGSPADVAAALVKRQNRAVSVRVRHRMQRDKELRFQVSLALNLLLLAVVLPIALNQVVAHKEKAAIERGRARRVQLAEDRAVEALLNARRAEKGLPPVVLVDEDWPGNSHAHMVQVLEQRGMLAKR